MYKVYVMTTEGGRWATNGLEFPTVVAAESYARDLFGRWMLVTDWVVVLGSDTDPSTESALAARGIVSRRG